MLTKWTSHQDYLTRLRTEILNLPPDERSRLLKLYANSLLKLSVLNLDPLLPVVKPLYTGFGRPATNQCEIIRSMILMIDVKGHSITGWVLKTQADPIIRILCGFQNNSIPNVASYYNLLDRLWLVPKPNRKKLRPFKRKPSKKYKANKKLPNRKPGVVKRLVAAEEKGKLPDIRPEKVLQQLLKHAVIDTSFSLGLFGDSSNISIAGDGSPFYAGSSPYGVRVCDCKSKGIHQCECPRKFSDPDASWGWDSYRERWFYGDSLYAITAANSYNDLPIFLQSGQASRHDGASTVFALRNVLNLYPELNVRNFLADGAMDDYSIYNMLIKRNIRPFIPLPDNTKFPDMKNYPQIKKFDDKGRPICPAGYYWVHWGFDKAKMRHKYRCQFSARHQPFPNCFTCIECNKNKSSYGPAFYIKSSNDVRLFPPVPRHTDSFKETFKRRSSVERTFKRIFEDYGIEAFRARSRSLRFSLAVFAAINMHLDAWIQHLDLSVDGIFPMLSAA